MVRVVLRPVATSSISAVLLPIWTKRNRPSKVSPTANDINVVGVAKEGAARPGTRVGDVTKERSRDNQRRRSWRWRGQLTASAATAGTRADAAEVAAVAQH